MQVVPEARTPVGFLRRSRARDAFGPQLEASTPKFRSCRHNVWLYSVQLTGPWHPLVPGSSLVVDGTCPWLAAFSACLPPHHARSPHHGGWETSSLDVQARRAVRWVSCIIGDGSQDLGSEAFWFLVYPTCATTLTL
jgi:hypothetical protein